VTFPETILWLYHKKQAPPSPKRPGHFPHNRRPAIKNKTCLTLTAKTAARQTVARRLKNKPYLPLKDQTVPAKSATLRLIIALLSAKNQHHFPHNHRPATKKRTPTYPEKPGRFRQNRRLAAKNTNPPYTEKRDRLSLSCRPATKKQIPPSTKYQGCFRQNRRFMTKKANPNLL
jgi:hypothetical protein